ncbi:MAG: rRNA pseudouridine synthase, partial [Treponemataceae bacterium]|nr:rRNA pseudouridine synthase [Treponemataceae bacterium]
IRDSSSHRMRVVLIEGKNREIRRVFEHAGAAIRSLERVRIGTVRVDGLRAGEFRELSPDEVRGLLAMCKN